MRRVIALREIMQTRLISYLSSVLNVLFKLNFMRVCVCVHVGLQGAASRWLFLNRLKQTRQTTLN